jgi:MFS family permease
VSSAVTLFYVMSALLLIPVGGGIRRVGPRPFVAVGGIALAGGVILIGRAIAPWHVYLAFLFIGIGWACLSTTAVATTLAPWFETFQGRAMSLASVGASAGGMIGVPLLLFGISRIGFGPTTAIAGIFTVVVLLPLAAFVLRHRPSDIGLFPDGLSPPVHSAAAASASNWTNKAALRTVAFRTVLVSFGIGMMMQIGFLTHQVTLLAQGLSDVAVSMTVSATAGAALVGRLTLARFADQVDVRVTATCVLLLAAASLAAMGLFPVPLVLIGGSVVFGLTTGNVTTLSAIIVRREFGAATFGTIFGIASCGIQLATALGPSFYGLLHDAFGNYRNALIMAALCDIAAAGVVFLGRRQLIGPARHGA